MKINIMVWVCFFSARGATVHLVFYISDCSRMQFTVQGDTILLGQQEAGVTPQLGFSFPKKFTLAKRQSFRDSKLMYRAL